MRNITDNLKIIVLLLFLPLSAIAGEKRGVAVVVDQKTYEICRTSVDNYAASVNSDGLKAYIIIDKWSHPDSIRAQLFKLYRHNNLEGAVFIGDIPVPMIRNAQHLTTAFKMDQKRPWNLSSIPSDRFYDDFDLKFEYLKKDSVYTLYHYYNLSDDSPHRINCDIYSARIKAPVVEGKSKYQLIDEYLQKAVREKQNKRRINSLTYFAGHGYNSDCMVARIDEKLALTEQFEIFKSGISDLNFINHTFDNFVKYRLMAELSREDLDLAILHHHGSDDAQYLNGSPQASMASEWIKLAKKFLRGKIRGAKDTSEAKKYYLDNYDIPASWVENAFDPVLAREDSLEDASVDITLPDMKGYVPNARMVIIDACFTGSFHLDDYISGHYIFSPGRTMVVKANSVNTLQDIWTDELAGLLDLGVSAGNWAKGQMTLESHLMGDPTYRYIPSRKDLENLDEDIVLKKGDQNFWRRMMKDTNPEVKSLAMKMLFLSGGISTDELLKIQQEETRATVRLQAFSLINKTYDHNLVPSLTLGMRDNYELLRRMAALKAGGNLSPELLDEMMEISLSPGESQRVVFELNSAIENYKKEDVITSFDKVVSGKSNMWYKKKDDFRKKLEYTLSRTEQEFLELTIDTIPAKNKKFTITSLRNSNNAAYLETLYRFFRESSNPELKILLAEAFGWYTNSWKREEIIDKCKELLVSEKDDSVRKELKRTINRLQY